jgi:hypothetical protein
MKAEDFLYKWHWLPPIQHREGFGNGYVYCDFSYQSLDVELTDISLENILCRIDEELEQYCKVKNEL